jgi:hypothetical protein
LFLNILINTDCHLLYSFPNDCAADDKKVDIMEKGRTLGSSKNNLLPVSESVCEGKQETVTRVSFSHSLFRIYLSFHCKSGPFGGNIHPSFPLITMIASLITSLCQQLSSLSFDETSGDEQAKLNSKTDKFPLKNRNTIDTS